MMCEDEKSYQAFLAYVDAMQKSDGTVDPDKAMAEVMDAMGKAAREAWDRDPWTADAASDKTLSTGTPFICTPVEK